MNDAEDSYDDSSAEEEEEEEEHVDITDVSFEDLERIKRSGHDGGFRKRLTGSLFGKGNKDIDGKQQAFGSKLRGKSESKEKKVARASKNAPREMR